MIKCFAEVETHPTRVFARLHFKGLRALTAGTLVMMPDTWAMLRPLLQQNTDYDEETIQPDNAA